MMKKIIVVDDEPGVIHTVKYGLESLDKELEIIGVDSGKHFFEILSQHPLPDLVILDIMMPEMNGWEIHHRLKQHVEWKKIPIIFLTATEDKTSKKIGGMYSEDFIEKPFTLPQLKQRVDMVLKKDRI